MIEPVTLFSTIAGVANLASRLTIDLTRLTVTLRNVPDQITQVCNEMVALNATLATLQQRFNPMSSGYSEEQLLCLETVISSTRETLVQLAKLNDACEVTGKKKPAKGGVSGMWKKVNWTLNESEIASYRSGLVGYTAMLNLLTATLADQRGANIEAMVTKTNEMLQALMEQRNRLSLMPPDNTDNNPAQQKALRKSRLPSIRTRSSSVASERRPSGTSQNRSQSVAPPTSRRSSAVPVPMSIRSVSSSRGGPSHVNSRATSRLRSVSATHLPLRASSPPPLPAAASHLNSDALYARSPASSHGLPTPPPEYTEIAADFYNEPPSTPAPSQRSVGSSQRQIVRSTPLSPPAPPIRPSSTRPASSRPSFRRSVSSASTRTVDSAAVPPVPFVPPVPLAREHHGGHKLEFAGKWSAKAIRINESFMGSGTLLLKKDDENKRILFNIRLDSSKETRLSYRWIESSSSTRTKQASMFAGPSYVLRSLVRADDYSGVFAGKTTIRLEDIDYLAGQRSFMIAINLIQQSPPEWLADTKPPERSLLSPLGIEMPSPIMSYSRNMYRPICAPSQSALSEPYTEDFYLNPHPSSFSRSSPSDQYAMYARVAAPPTPPRSPSDISAGSNNLSAAESRTPRPNHERAPLQSQRAPRDVRPRCASTPRENIGGGEVSAEAPPAATKRGRQRSRRGPASWFSFGRN
ncbi:hypothetical protein TWF696_004875 [Orbilia brochopaga]|uniref:Fungal N-terminal domain-containing protein n=1 Tax=Orbilia brochopaga TaxID=3140254 RepID=A0AAV9UZT4_9PEZI